MKKNLSILKSKIFLFLLVLMLMPFSCYAYKQFDDNDNHISIVYQDELIRIKSDRYRFAAKSSKGAFLTLEVSDSDMNDSYADAEMRQKSKKRLMKQLGKKVIDAKVIPLNNKHWGINFVYSDEKVLQGKPQKVMRSQLDLAAHNKMFTLNYYVPFYEYEINRFKYSVNWDIIVSQVTCINHKHN